MPELPRALRLPTIRDIAREADVSVSAVSHAFNRPEQISPKLRERILHLAAERGYRPDPRARGLRRGESRLVALLVTNLANVYYAAIANAAQEALARDGFHLVIVGTGGTREGETRGLDAVAHERMAGAILDTHHLAKVEIERAYAPVVAIVDESEAIATSCVRLRNYGAAHMAVAHLIGSGRRRIAHITGPLDSPGAVRRRDAYRAALAGAGLRGPFEAPGDYTFATGRTAMEALLAGIERLDGLFAANDLTALGALAAIRARGLRVPDDIAVIGFDNIEEATWSVPPLTTVDQPTAQIGAAAARLLLATIGDPALVSYVEMECALVQRASA